MPSNIKCVVCETPDCSRTDGEDSTRFDCPRCGSFRLAGSAVSILPSKLKDAPVRRALMSHKLRMMQRPKQERLHIITSYDLESFWKDQRLPTPQAQADNLILWLGDRQEMPFSWVEASPAEIAASVGIAVAPSGDSQGFGWLHSQLEDKKLYQLGNSAAGKAKLRLTMAGWERFEALNRTAIRSRTAFIAMKFGDAVLDKVVAECFKPAVERTGFELRKLTDDQPAGLIDNQLRAAILSARFLIADLSHGNQGAYWEAGFAEGMGLPVIYTCEEDKWKASKTHFDTNHMLTILWDSSSLERAGNELTATIRATLRAEAKQSDN